MRKIEQLGVLVFHENEESGIPLKYADNPDECATFRNSAEALREMEERGIDYGVCTEIVDLESEGVVLRTTDKGRTWNVPTREERAAVPVPA